MARLKVLLTRCLFIAAALAMIQILVSRGTLSPLIVSKPTAVALALWQEIAGGEIPKLFLITMGEVAISFGISLVLGLGVGYFLWRYERWGVAYETLLGAVFGSPIILVYPIFLVIFGRSPAAVIAMGFLSGCIPIILGMRDGLVGVNRTLVRVGQSLNLSRRVIFWKIQLPAAAPTIFSGMRLGFTFTLVSVIGVEFLVEIGGLGKMVSAAYSRFQIDNMYAGITAIILLTMIFIAVSYNLQRRVK
ncbi:MAG TPA: ABC transporter permease subunit [bacterium]|nr:ABC transporter permease subunit [bacterium]